MIVQVNSDGDHKVAWTAHCDKDETLMTQFVGITAHLQTSSNSALQKYLCIQQNKLAQL